MKIAHQCFAAVALLLSLAVANAAPMTYSFTFGTQTIDAQGTFTTGAAADPGYFLLTALSFTSLRVEGVLQTGLASTTSFIDGAAYNPTSGAFVNHSGGGTYDNFGGADVAGHLGPYAIAILDPTAFAQNNTTNFLSGLVFQNAALTRFAFDDLLTITAVPQAVPAPESLTLLLAGAFGLGLASRRRAKSV